MGLLGWLRVLISIHALLAESDNRPSVGASAADGISIHALLAESDYLGAWESCDVRHFYPRSPCGERLMFVNLLVMDVSISIHALLAESDCQHS